MLFLHTNPERITDVAINIHVTETSITVNDEEYTLEYLKTKNDFRDFCLMLFPLSNLGKVGVAQNINGTEKITHYISKSLPPFDAFSISYDSKSKYLSHLQPTLNLPISMAFYPETQNMKDALLIVQKQSSDVPFKITTTDSKKQIIDYVPDYEGLYQPNRILPKCTLKADEVLVSTNGIELEFNYRDMNSIFRPVNCTAVTKTNKGYVSHNKISVVNGIGRFKFIPLGLDSGEKVDVQVGIGKYSKLCNIELTVA